jgi:hypothetical protein
MSHRTNLFMETRVTGLTLVVMLGCLACGTKAEKVQPGWSGPLVASDIVPNANLGQGVSGDGGLPCTPEDPGARPHEAGNYDTRSCNSPDCHSDMIGGGWLFANPSGLPWVGGATITISNIDGSIVKARSAEDGFFQITDPVKPPFKACVSLCPGANCSLIAHPNSDCQTSTCHGKTGQRIYVTLNKGETTDAGVGSAADAGAAGCSAPTPGGPYVHTEWVYGNQPCSGGGCHSPPKAIFNGGFLYDGPTSTTTIPEATIQLIGADGSRMTTVSGIDGMFFFGTVSADSVPWNIKAPYTACVSKCPLSVCSATNSHTTNGDCQTSSCHNWDMKVFLR